MQPVHNPWWNFFIFQDIIDFHSKIYTVNLFCYLLLCFVVVLYFACFCMVCCIYTSFVLLQCRVYAIYSCIFSCCGTAIGRVSGVQKYQLENGMHNML